MRLRASVTAFAAMSGEGGLPAEAASLRLVETVPAAGHMDPQKRLRQWPDVLAELPAEGFVVEPGQTRALWLTVQVPATATPGEYEATVAMAADGGETAALPVRLRVHKPLIPNPSEWSLRVDFWQSFGRLAKQYRVPEWSEEWWAIVRVFLDDLAAHGQSVVQVGRGHFDWRINAGGEWVFGFERFDRYVETCQAAGIDGLIEYLQMFDGRGATTLWYTDAAGRRQSMVANPGEREFDEVWVAFARALAAHCRQKGWIERLFVCPTDEPQDVYGQPTLDRFKACRRLLRDADPAIRTTAALDSLRSARMLSGDIDRFVFKLREDVYDPALAHELDEQGKLVEAYICCHPEHPNSFITSEGIEQRAIGWILWQERLQGLLRWSYVNWPADVWERPEGDGRYAPGDLFIVYPGDRKPVASARWERMRDGFEDYEMLRVVSRMIQKSRSATKTEAQAALEAAVGEIAGPQRRLTEYVRDSRRLLEARGRLLAAADSL